MSARILIIVLGLVRLAFVLVKMRLADLQRKEPLPPEVADVYEPERYRQYLNYVADNRRAALVFMAVSLVVDAALLLSGIYRGIEAVAGGNPYLIVLMTFGVFVGLETVEEIVESYYSTFHIEEKYGLNKQTRRDFAKDALLDILQEILITSVLLLLLTFIGEHLSVWTAGFTIPLWKAFLITLAIAAGLSAFSLVASLFSIWILKKQYTFTPMPEGGLRDKILELQEGSKKKVKEIYIYDESKKSTSKNAFLLKLLWHREFGIADNFIRENAEEELLAVLSHEIGHLKHKKNLLNYLRYAFIAAVFALMVFLMDRPQMILQMNAWIRTSFDVTVNNYYVWVLTLSAVLVPVSKIISVADNYRSRQEEYEADREAVKNGYGEAMIATFKRLSSDELVNVNPHPWIEFLEYDHPGMAQRIRAIRKAEKNPDAPRT